VSLPLLLRSTAISCCRHEMMLSRNFTCARPDARLPSPARACCSALGRTHAVARSCPELSLVARCTHQAYLFFELRYECWYLERALSGSHEKFHFLLCIVSKSN
jgi:hypothetical protein